jgi:hypothetical protein
MRTYNHLTGVKIAKFCHKHFDIVDMDELLSLDEDTENEICEARYKSRRRLGFKDGDDSILFEEFVK